MKVGGERQKGGQHTRTECQYSTVPFQESTLVGIRSSVKEGEKSLKTLEKNMVVYSSGKVNRYESQEDPFSS